MIPHSSGAWEIPRYKCLPVCSASGEFSSWLVDVRLLAVFSQVWRWESEFSCLLIRALIPWWGPTLITSSKPNHPHRLDGVQDTLPPNMARCYINYLKLKESEKNGRSRKVILTVTVHGLSIMIHSANTWPQRCKCLRTLESGHP